MVNSFHRRLSVSVLSVVAIFFVSIVVWKLFNPTYKYVVVRGEVKLAQVLNSPPLVKGGQGVRTRIEYSYTYKEKVYFGENIECRFLDIHTANTQKAEQVTAINELVEQFKSKKDINVRIREDAPTISCILEDGKRIQSL